MTCRRTTMTLAAILVIAICEPPSVRCFTSTAIDGRTARVLPTVLHQSRSSSSSSNGSNGSHGNDKSVRSVDVGSGMAKGGSLLLSIGIFAGSLAFSGVAYADEVGRTVDAPTLFTGEETMICMKRGPLGACKKSEKRTAENDNDKATKYFNDPELKFQEKYKAAQLQAIEDEQNGLPKAGSAEFDGNALIARLKQQTEDNRAKNESIVRQKTLQNNLGASFGPFSSTVPILNADGVDYTLLAAPQAMRLKKAGYIDDKKKFITQPPQEALDEALEAAENSAVAKVGGVIKKGFSYLTF